MVCTRCQVPRYQPVQDQEVYTLALPSYLVAGGDGYSMIAKEMLKHNSGEGGGWKTRLPLLDYSSSSIF